MNNIKSAVGPMNNSKNRLNSKKNWLFKPYQTHTQYLLFFSTLKKIKKHSVPPLQEQLKELRIEIFLRERSNSLHLPLCKAHGWENDTSLMFDPFIFNGLQTTFGPNIPYSKFGIILQFNFFNRPCHISNNGHNKIFPMLKKATPMLFTLPQDSYYFELLI